MGLKNYFHPAGKDAPPQKPAAAVMAPARSKPSGFPSLSSMKLGSKQSPVAAAPNNVELGSIPSSNTSQAVKSPARPMYPGGDFRNSSSPQLTDMKADVMANWLYQRQQERMWTHGGWDEGVIMKKARDDYISCPAELLQHRNGFYDSIKKLNVKVCTEPFVFEDTKADGLQCALTINTQVVKLFLRNNDMHYVPLDNGLRIQVLPNVNYLPECQKHHFAAFIQEPSMLVVWDDDPNHLLSRAQNVEDQLMKMIWEDDEENEKASTAVASKVPSKAPSKMGSRAPSVYVGEVDGSQDGYIEKGLAEAPRKIVLIQPVLTAITLILVIAALGAGWRQVALEVSVDKGWLRLAFVVVVPLQIWLALVGSRDDTFAAEADYDYSSLCNPSLAVSRRS